MEKVQVTVDGTGFFIILFSVLALIGLIVTFGGDFSFGALIFTLIVGFIDYILIRYEINEFKKVKNK